MDGFPDLLVPSINEKGNAIAQLWENVRCNKNTCGELAANSNRRTFSLVTKGTDALTSILNVYASAFFDMNEDVSVFIE